MTPLFNDFITDVFGPPSIARNATLKILEQQMIAEMLAERQIEVCDRKGECLDEEDIEVLIASERMEGFNE